MTVPERIQILQIYPREKINLAFITISIFFFFYSEKNS